MPKDKFSREFTQMNTNDKNGGLTIRVCEVNGLLVFAPPADGPPVTSEQVRLLEEEL